MPSYVVFFNRDNMDNSALEALGPARMSREYRTAAIGAREKAVRPAYDSFMQEVATNGLTGKIETAGYNGLPFNQQTASVFVTTDEKTAQVIAGFKSVSSIQQDGVVLTAPQPRKREI